MFIGSLKKEQQEYFLSAAQYLMAADGKIDERETSILETLTAHCDPDVTPLEDISAVSPNALFSDRRSQVACLLELVGVALADESYDESEKAIIHDLTSTFGLSQALLEDIENWVSRQMSLMREAQQMMMEG